MLLVGDKGTVPPKGWRFTVKQTGSTFGGADYSRLYNRALADLEAHGIPIPLDYRQQFDDELCRQIPGMNCEVAAPATKETRKLTAGDALRFLKVLNKWVGSKRELVPQAEAERRAEICAGCPYNVAITGCSACQGMSGIILALINNRRTRFNAQLKGCAVCACENRAQVHFPLEVLHKGVTPEMEFPAWCWKRPGTSQPS